MIADARADKVIASWIESERARGVTEDQIQKGIASCQQKFLHYRRFTLTQETREVQLNF